MFHVRFCESFLIFKHTSRGCKECVLCIFLMVLKLCLLIPKTLKIGIWSMKMALMPYLNPTYRWFENIFSYWHWKYILAWKVRNLLFLKPLHVLGFSPPIISTIYLCSPSLSGEALQKNYFIWGWEDGENSSNSHKTSSARRAVLSKVTWTEIH